MERPWIPLYRVGERVYHLPKQCWGTVTELIGGTEKRYYVKHSGWMWSVPEKCLEIVVKESGG